MAIYTLRGNCGSVRVAARIAVAAFIPRTQSYQASGGIGANGVIRVNVASGRLSASGSGRFRRRTLAIVERRMLRHLVSVATRRI